MNVSKENEAKLAELELTMGRHRGRLALAADLISDAIVEAGNRGAAAGNPQKLTQILNESRQLVQTVLHELKGKK